MGKFYKNTFVRIALLSLVVVYVILFVALRLEINALDKEGELLKAELDEMTEYVDKLQSELDRPMDDEYIAEIAHDKLGLRYPQEIIFYSGDE